jgi:hypothetical protein
MMTKLNKGDQCRQGNHKSGEGARFHNEESQISQKTTS